MSSIRDPLRERMSHCRTVLDMKKKPFKHQLWIVVAEWSIVSVVMMCLVVGERSCETDLGTVHTQLEPAFSSYVASTWRRPPCCEDSANTGRCSQLKGEGLSCSFTQLSCCMIHTSQLLSFKFIWHRDRTGMWPMPNVMAARLNIGGALCWMRVVTLPMYESERLLCKVNFAPGKLPLGATAPKMNI